MFLFHKFNLVFLFHLRLASLIFEKRKQHSIFLSRPIKMLFASLFEYLRRGQVSAHLQWIVECEHYSNKLVNSWNARNMLPNLIAIQCITHQLMNNEQILVRQYIALILLYFQQYFEVHVKSCKVYSKTQKFSFKEYFAWYIITAPSKSASLAPPIEGPVMKFPLIISITPCLLPFLGYRTLQQILSTMIKPSALCEAFPIKVVNI